MYAKKLKKQATILDRLHQHVEKINSIDSFEDDFTILEVAFS